MPLLSRPLQDKISITIGSNEYSLGVFLNLAKAFDIVGHGILLKKLNIYGLRRIQINWFASYFENRWQLVCCNGAFSTMRAKNLSVLQVSNQGPLLFLIYLNDLPNISSLMFLNLIC